MKELNLSARQAAEIIGTSHTTILRAASGEIVDLDTVIKISDWLGVRPSRLLNSFSQEQDVLDERITALIEGNPKLKEVFKRAMTLVENNEIDPTIIEDIVAYSSFKLGNFS
jgi:transcriptional regulator with XRE-family HTH domain